MPDMCARHQMEADLAGLIMLASGHHSTYVDEGFETSKPPDLKCSLDSLLVVVDGDGWSTLHRVQGILRRPGGVINLRLGPRVAWPDGRVAARPLSAYAPEADEQRRKDIAEARDA